MTMPQVNRLHFWVTLTLLGLFLAGALPGTGPGGRTRDHLGRGPHTKRPWP